MPCKTCRGRRATSCSCRPGGPARDHPQGARQRHGEVLTTMVEVEPPLGPRAEVPVCLVLEKLSSRNRLDHDTHGP